MGPGEFEAKEGGFLERRGECRRKYRAAGVEARVHRAAIGIRSHGRVPCHDLLQDRLCTVRGGHIKLRRGRGQRWPEFTPRQRLDTSLALCRSTASREKVVQQACTVHYTA